MKAIVCRLPATLNLLRSPHAYRNCGQYLTLLLRDCTLQKAPRRLYFFERLKTLESMFVFGMNINWTWKRIKATKSCAVVMIIADDIRDQHVEKRGRSAE